MDEESNETLIRDAYFSLLLSGRKYEYLDLAVAQEALKLKRLYDAGNLPNLVLESKRITGVVRSITFEESSQRYVIEFEAEEREHREKIRSERLDGWHGKAAKAVWGRDLVGHKVIIFKKNEPGKDAGASNGYRVAPYCVDLGLED